MSANVTKSIRDAIKEQLWEKADASHVAYMSHPKETVKLIEEAATSAHVN
jgi:hypothetical protein